MPLSKSRLLTESGFAHAFPERTADDGELARAVGADAGARAIVQVKQVHGSAVYEVEPAGPAGVEADALVARAGREGPPPTRGAAPIGVRVADCVPILVADEASGDVAAIHAGWRGVVGGVVAAAVERLRSGRLVRLVAAIGPCIGGCCFEVDRDVADAIARAAAGAHVVVAVTSATGERGEKALVDLRAAVRAQLVSAGVDAARIEDVPGCTKHEPSRFHSFRRDGAASGRMLVAIAPRDSTRAPSRETLAR